MKDIFDYNNVKGILAGMSDQQLSTLAEKLVEQFPKTADYFSSYLEAHLQDKIVRENESAQGTDKEAEVMRGTDNGVSVEPQNNGEKNVVAKYIMVKRL